MRDGTYGVCPIGIDSCFTKHVVSTDRIDRRSTILLVRPIGIDRRSTIMLIRAIGIDRHSTILLVRAIGRHTAVHYTLSITIPVTKKYHIHNCCPPSTFFCMFRWSWKILKNERDRCARAHQNMALSTRLEHRQQRSNKQAPHSGTEAGADVGLPREHRVS